MGSIDKAPMTIFLIVLLLIVIASHATAGAACDADSFLAKVSLLKETTPPFRHDAHHPAYHPPERDTSTPVDEEMLRHLRNAFGIAPRFFQQQLCELTGIFIVPDCPGCPSAAWGFRERPDMFPPDRPPQSFGRYLGFSTGSPPNYRQYETMLLHALLRGWSSPQFAGDSLDPADTPAMTMLAALAHERGHVLFRDLHVPVPGTPFDFNRFCDGTFFTGSWKSPIDVEPDFRFNNISTTRHIDGEVSVEQLLSAIKPPPGDPPDYALAGRLLHRLYEGKRFVGLWAAFTPEHDFVETFKYYVLSHAHPPLTSLPLIVQAASDASGEARLSSEDVLRIPEASELARKMRCFAKLF